MGGPGRLRERSQHFGAKPPRQKRSRPPRSPRQSAARWKRRPRAGPGRERAAWVGPWGCRKLRRMRGAGGSRRRGKRAAMLGKKGAPTAEAQIARAAAPAAFGNADAAIVAKIRQFAQMPGGKQKALEAAEQVFGKLRAKDMLREIRRPRTTMPTVYSP